MDRTPKYVHQTFVLVWSLLDLAQVAPEQLVVHATEGCDDAVLSSMRELGVRVHTVQPFAEGFPNCNKLRQVENPELLQAEVCVLLDTDTAVLRDISAGASAAAIRARAVAGPNPPVERLESIFRAAGFETPPARGETAYDGLPTLRVNCNGGVYFLPRHALQALSTEWPRWARWLIEHSPELLPEHSHFTLDQVSFGLACHGLGLEIDLLPIEMNYQIRTGKPNADMSPLVLHYHSHVTPTGLIRPIGQRRVDEAIERVNRVIRRRRERSFDSRLFWDFHYVMGPGPGAGRDAAEVLSIKRCLLQEQLAPAPYVPVLDIGCGDLEAVLELPLATYTGVDISPEAVRIAKEKKPSWTLLVDDARTAPVYPHDTVLCLDVLIHQPTREEYEELLTRIVALTRRSLLVSGYDQPPVLEPEGTFYYEPLSEGLRRVAPGKIPTILGGYRDMTVFRLDLDEPERARSGPPESRGVVHVETPYGVFHTFEGDQMTDQLERFGAHTRNELAMLLSLVRKGDLVIDVGAHIGTFAVPLAQAVGEEGRVIAVEPDPISLPLLRDNVKANGVECRVEIVETLVSDRPGSYLKVFNPDNTGFTHFMEDEGGAAVPVSSLDELWRDRAGCGPIDLIKIDTEGMELRVLRSGAELFAQQSPVLYLEVVEMFLRRHDCDVAALAEWLAFNGYAIFRNSGARHSRDDSFNLVRLPDLAAGGLFFDCLAVPRQRLQALGLPTG